MSRSDLKELGERLDEGECGLVVVAAADVSARVEAAITHAEKVTEKQLQADESALDADIDEANAEN
jgi:hypothetical protein